MSNDSSAPTPPDYTGLAREQGAINKEAALEQTIANRSNVYTPFGQQNWYRNPTTGQWTNTQEYNPEIQAMIDAQTGYGQRMTGAAGGLLGGIESNLSQPMDFSGMVTPEQWEGGTLPGQGLADLPDSGFGAVEQVQQAMMGRLNPALQEGRGAEIARLKSQGITEGTPAWESAMRMLNQKDVDAQQQALLGAASEYGNIFNRGLAARKELFGEQKDIYDAGNKGQVLERAAATDDYNRQMNEMLMSRYAGLDDYKALMGQSNIPGLNFNAGGSGGAGNYTPEDIVGAASSSYEDQIARYNASQARKGGLMGGIGTIAGGIIGGMYGQPVAGAAAGGALGNYIGGS